MPFKAGVPKLYIIIYHFHFSDNFGVPLPCGVEDWRGVRGSSLGNNFKICSIIVTYIGFSENIFYCKCSMIFCVFSLLSEFVLVSIMYDNLLTYNNENWLWNSVLKCACAICQFPFYHQYFWTDIINMAAYNQNFLVYYQW